MSPPNNPKPTLTPPESGVTVRMYDLQGEGDCFLLAFRSEDGAARYMLIDCGIFVGTSGGAKRLRDIAKDIAKATGNHLHVLVATHEHWDHLIGFHYARETFSKEKMTVDQVWLAWTENPEDALAKLLHDKHEAALAALASTTMQLEALDDPGAGPIKDVLAYAWDFEGALGVNTNDLMEKVHKELSNHPPTYCSPEQPPLTLDGVPGVRFFVLGPPRNEDLLKVLEEESEVHGATLALDEATAFYAAALAAFGADVLGADAQDDYKNLSEQTAPFGVPLGMNKEQAEAYKVNEAFFFQKHYGFAEKDPEKGWRRIDSDWLATAGNLALQMDNYTNNTSLVLAIELIDSGKVLLFPGDAQVGNWLGWKDTVWTVEDNDGDNVEISGMDLVGRTTFYKVGHHGSHNATLVDYLRQMRDDLVAMIPVNEAWANEKKDWEHPGKTLLKELIKQTRGRIVRADTRVSDIKPAELTQGEWDEFLGKVQQDRGAKKLWIQYDVTG